MPRVRSREYLTQAEVERLIEAAGDNRNGHRDSTMILVAYRHGLRAAEMVTLRWNEITSATACMSAGPRTARTASNLWSRVASAASARARRTALAIRVHVGARCAVHHGGLSQDGCSARCSSQVRRSASSAYAAAWLRLQARQ